MLGGKHNANSQLSVQTKMSEDSHALFCQALLEILLRTDYINQSGAGAII